MSDPLIYDSDNYVIIEPGKKEQLLNEKETLLWLENWLIQFEELPSDLKAQNSVKDAAQRLLDTACALQIKPGLTIEWFAIRLENSHS